VADPLLRLYVWQLTHPRYAPDRTSRPSRPPRDDRGEGVISAAIAVLIMAFLGVVVWVGFKATLDNTQQKVDKQVDEIGE
jgi:type VI protein secretion system component VasF